MRTPASRFVICILLITPSASADFVGVVASRNTDVDTTNLCTNDPQFKGRQYKRILVVSRAPHLDQQADTITLDETLAIKQMMLLTQTSFLEAVAGASGTRSAQGGGPDCGNVVCCGLVCAADPLCCEGWDQICAGLVEELCPPPECGDGTCDPNEDECNCPVDCPGGCPCPADLNGDGIVNAADLAELLGNWGPCVGCPADLNGDRNVDAADLATLLGNWGPCP